MRSGRRLDDLDPFRAGPAGCVTMVVETTKGSRNKLAFDLDLGTMRLRHVLPEGLAFPFDFGFVPGTAAGDGDPLDILLLCDEGMPSGTVLEARVIGIITAQQRRGDGPSVENNRILAVPEVAKAAAAIHRLDDLRPGLLDEIEAFLVTYNSLRGLRFELLGRGGPEAALDAVRAACRAGSVASS